jgi:putative transposase
VTEYQTIRLRVADKHAAVLRRKARAVTLVWNYCNETQMKAAKSGRRWLSGYDLQKLTAGSSKELGLSGNSIANICEQYADRRRYWRKPWLRFRSRKSLGWVPFKGASLRKRGRCFVFNKIAFSVLHDREETSVPKYGNGSFNCDARGRWYLNICVPTEALEPKTKIERPVGIDLGLKELVALSTGEIIENPKQFARLAGKLGRAQRAGKRRLAASTHAKIKNSRADFLHKLSKQITDRHDLIVVGNVSSAKLVKTRFAKSVLDAGWATLRHQLSYKSIRNGGGYAVVSEHLTSQSCSSCGCLPPERPRGIAGLGIRTFNCSECGVSLDRDVNAARNILSRFSQETLAEGAAKDAELTKGVGRCPSSNAQFPNPQPKG